VAESIARRLFEAGLLTDFRNLTDAGYEAAARLDSLSLRLQHLRLDGALASRTGNEPLCEKLWLERADLCRQIKDVEHCADTLIDLAWQAFEQGDNYKSRLRLLEALRLARSVQDPIFVATARVVQARLAFAASNTRLAAHRSRQAEAILPQCTNRSGALFLYQNLLISFRELGQLEKSAEYTLELLRSSIERHQVVHAGWALLELGPLYEQTGRFDLAAKCYSAALKVHAEYQTRLKARAATAFTQFKKKCEDPVATALLISLRNRSWQEIVRGLTET
jgi:tetratricopeptide (TPR) repeat protein